MYIAHGSGILYVTCPKDEFCNYPTHFVTFTHLELDGQMIENMDPFTVWYTLHVIHNATSQYISESHSPQKKLALTNAYFLILNFDVA